MPFSDEATPSLEEFRLVTGPTEERLSQRELLDYRTQREACYNWLLTWGKDPEKAKGYAQATVESRGARMDIFYRWVWEQLDGYTSDITHEHADEYMRHLAQQDTSLAHKASTYKAIRMLMKWYHHERGLDAWEPPFKFSSSNQSTRPRDYLTRPERAAIREAALGYGAVPSFDRLTPDERDRWRAYLAQRFEKPKEELTHEDWERANNWKITSLVWTSLDAGLRPIEVERAVVGWVDVDNELLRIPKQQSSKNREPWRVSIQTRTADALDRWLSQRSTREKYDDTDALWLTREANPYQSSSLRRLLHRLCDQADIDVENRQMSWYAIRHSTGTYMTREEDLKAAQTQLRHLSPKSTMKYDQAPAKDRRDALERMR